MQLLTRPEIGVGIGVVGAYGVLTVALLALPLLNVLHVESAAVTALVAFFVAGFAAVYRFRADEDVAMHRVLWENEVALVVPLAGLTLSMLWAPNCAYATGLLFYVLFPGITVVFAVMLAYALTGAAVRRPYWGLGATGLALAVGGPLYDLGLHPQFYTYNHVFGGVLGPIYDEQLAMRPGLFVFRGLTLLWAGVAWGVGAWLRGTAGRWMAASGSLLALGIGAIYGFGASLGINTTEAHTQRQLGGHASTAHFDLYYAPDHLSAAKAQALAADQERHYATLVDRLALSDGQRPARIAVYLYPTPDAKAALTGARSTSVAPVWLPTPQVHLLQERHAAHFRHELAHIFGRPFGLPLVNASWAVGLVEGWAVALEASGAAPAPHDLVATAAATSTGGVRAQAEAIAERLSPLGFWTDRGAVSYTTMGSFVRFLLDRYGPGPLKAVYATASFETAYGRPLATLAREWAEFLASRSALHRSAHALVMARFTRPSLFETTCPHYVPPARRHRQTADRALATGDTAAALSALDRAITAAPTYAAAHRQWARLRLAQGAADEVRGRLDTLQAATADVGLLLARADAAGIAGATDAARRLYAETFDRLPRYAVSAQAAVVLRDAVAHRPDVLRILVSGADTTQARRLSQSRVPTAPVRAWTALRWQTAARPERAAALWNGVDAQKASPGRSALWHRTLQLAVLRWRALAARDACDAIAARRRAREAASAFRTYGHLNLASAMAALAKEPPTCSPSDQTRRRRP
jgi:hypothetical protein